MDVAFHPEKIDPTAFVAPGAFIIGDVTIGPESSVWFGVILRGDIAVLQLIVIYFTPWGKTNDRLLPASTRGTSPLHRRYFPGNSR